MNSHFSAFTKGKDFKYSTPFNWSFHLSLLNFENGLFKLWALLKEPLPSIVNKCNHVVCIHLKISEAGEVIGNQL